MPPAPHLHKHAAVGRTLEPRLRIVLAMLCVALSFVFAGASAASVVDEVEHAARIAHEHSPHLSFDMVDGDHHADSPVGGDYPDPGAEAGDHQPGAGHHHSDAPVGALSTALDTGRAIASAGPRLRINGAARAKDVRPGGLERPPKRDANLS